MSYLSYLCLFVHSGVQHILCCFFVFVLCLVYPMLPFSLDYPFWIARSVLSDIYSSTNQIGTIELLVNLDFFAVNIFINQILFYFCLLKLQYFRTAFVY
jgi:hypothetical protein